MMFSAAGDTQPVASTLFSAYASLAGLKMLIRAMAKDLVPGPVRTFLQSAIHRYFEPVISKQSTIVVETTIVVDEHYGGMTRNQVFDAAEVYLRTKISPNTERFKVGKTSKQKGLSISLEKGEEIRDRQGQNQCEMRFFELSFNKNYKDRVVNEYLPYVLAKSKEIKDNDDKVVKLYTRDCPYRDDDGYGGGGGGIWGSINLDHPATFETLAMEPELKKAIIDDLERFLKRKEFYKKVGKAWKRGYFLYGPPGTEMQDRTGTEHHYDPNRKLTLSGFLNFIDGLWSSCGDERIIIFTSNYKEKLDPALLRPGRMDMHIHMSYCTGQGFRVLASNYLDIHDHHMLFGEIEDLIAKVEVTPAEVAEELMKSEDADIALAGLLNFLKHKKIKGNEIEEDKANGLETDGKTLATVAAQLKVSNCSDNETIQKFPGHPGDVRSMINTIFLLLLLMFLIAVVLMLGT
ncbi:hypothetical protein Vadar_020009 [Vaccinium darrowii]|uniref:Uncharacterized protein n=1 Tax=Vaccinium darrowii TaxID=229202 RepID=A0ACB7ZF20_9ERIC|nr:hypothetical protein Vadar_020009 [Vaccinium darrowii]